VINLREYKLINRWYDYICIWIIESRTIPSNIVASHTLLSACSSYPHYTFSNRLRIKPYAFSPDIASGWIENSILFSALSLLVPSYESFAREVTWYFSKCQVHSIPPRNWRKGDPIYMQRCRIITFRISY